MTTVIKLDASAIQLLFPEGSEQRIEISNAVAAEITRKMFTKQIELKMHSIYANQNAIVDDIIEGVIKENIVAKDSAWYTSSRDIKLNSDITRTIQEYARGALTSILDNKIREAINKTVDERIDRVAYDTVIGKRVSAKVSDAINAAIEEQMKNFTFKVEKQ